MREWVALGLLAVAAPAAAAPPHRFVACVPDAPGSSAAAEPVLNAFFRALEGALGWEPGRVSGLFTTSKSRCRKELKRPRSSFAMLSAELYLAWRKRLHLQALVVAEVGGKSSTSYHVAVREGAAAKPEDLARTRFFAN